MTGNLRIERAALHSQTVSRLISLLNGELAATYPEPGANHFGLTAEEVAPGRGVFLVAHDGDEAVGCGAVRLIGAGEAEIKRMFVVPEARGRGISRRILTALEDEARALGVTRMLLETGERQAPALGLYESAGYVRCERFGEYMDSPLSVCMEKRLSS